MEIDVNTEYHKGMDKLEKFLSEEELYECPITHHFVDGVYCREMFVQKGVTLTSKIHKTKHPFILSMGKIGVIDNNKEPKVFEAPYFGITMPGTRRLIYAFEDSIWTTIHATDIVPDSDSEEDLEKAAQKVEDIIIQKHDNKLLKKEDKWLS